MPCNSCVEVKCEARGASMFKQWTKSWHTGILARVQDERARAIMVEKDVFGKVQRVNVCAVC